MLYQMSRDYVGDTAETVSLLWPEPAVRAARSVAQRGRLDGCGARAQRAGAGDRRIFSTASIVRGRWALLKLLGGAPRVGVSARLAKMALAEMSGHDVAEIEEVWHALAPPYTELFALARRQWRAARAPRASSSSARSCSPIRSRRATGRGSCRTTSRPNGNGTACACRSPPTARTRASSRAPATTSRARFPRSCRPTGRRDAVLDGELLVVRNGEIAPFNDLQQRLNRKTVTPRMMKEHPAFVRLYDLLFDGERRSTPALVPDRRARLEAGSSA